MYKDTGERGSDIDRGTGILSPRDRKWLLHGEEPESKQGRYQQRKGMEKRVYSALLDFPAIHQMPTKVRRGIFDDLATDAELYGAVRAALGFFNRGCDDGGVDFERAVEEGVQDAEMFVDEQMDEDEYGLIPNEIMTDVDVEITKTYKSVRFDERLLKRWREGEELTANELGVLVSSDAFDAEAAEELKRRKEQNE